MELMNEGNQVATPNKYLQSLTLINGRVQAVTFEVLSADDIPVLNEESLPTATGVGPGTYRSAQVTVDQYGRIVAIETAPAIFASISEGPISMTANDPGTPGEVRVDPFYAYLCVSAFNWRRFAHSTW